MAGQPVVCLHASASSGRQWRALADSLAGRFAVIAPDLHGSGQAPQWTHGRPLELADEVGLVRPALAGLGQPVHLVGHSYGGAVALHAALAEPDRFRSLVLFEPVLFALLLAEDPDQPAAREILAVRDDTAAAVERGELAASGARFVDYWMGPGTWPAMPASRQAATATAMGAVRCQWDALFGDRTPLSAFATLAVPTLFLTGTRSPASSRGVARLLLKTLPAVTTVELDGVGHMAPVTHPDVVNGVIEAHLAGAG